jgi:hypothetical protein
MLVIEIGGTELTKLVISMNHKGQHLGGRAKMGTIYIENFRIDIIFPRKIVGYSKKVDTRWASTALGPLLNEIAIP